MKPTLSTAALPKQLIAAGLLLATVAWMPGTIERVGGEGTAITRDNASVRVLNGGAMTAATPELPWFLKPANDPQKVRQTGMRMLKEGQSQVKFTENRGQLTDQYGGKRKDVLYYGNANDVQIYFTRNQIGFVLPAEAAPRSIDAEGRQISAVDLPATKQHVVSMELLGTREDVRVEASEATPGVYNYIRGEQSEWIMGVESYRRLRYHEVYRGIDMIVESRGSSVKYDFEVSAGADASQIRFRYTGAESVTVSESGRLVVRTPVGVIEEGVPYSYQGSNEEVSNAYRVDADGMVRFDLGSYDPSRTLTIDPEVIWSSFFGGDGMESFEDVEMLSDGSFVVVGYSGSSSITTMSPQRNRSMVTDGIVARFDANCSLVWYTYIGGNQSDEITSVDIDGGNIYVMGTTGSRVNQAFPIQGSVPQPTKNNATRDQFVACFNSSGNILWSSYKGGNGQDYGAKISVRTVNGTRVIAGIGNTESTYPVSATTEPAPGCAVPLQRESQGATDAVVFRWTETNSGGIPNGATESWATHFGGLGIDAGTGVEIASNGDILIAGWTESMESGPNPFPTAGGATVRKAHHVNETGSGNDDAFAARFNAAGCLIYSGFIGGLGNDRAVDTGIDDNDNFYIVGRTLSSDFSGTELLPDDGSRGQKYRGGAADAFLTVVQSDGAIVYSTYHGGSGDDFAVDVDVIPQSSSRNGDAIVVVSGNTSSNDMPVSRTANQLQSQALAIQATRGGSHDPLNISHDQFIVSFSITDNVDNPGQPIGVTLGYRLWSTYYGGSGDDYAQGIAAATIGGIDHIIVVGNTDSPNYLTLSKVGAFNQASGSDLPDATLLLLKLINGEKLPLGGSIAIEAKKEGEVQLDWTTDDETNNAGFEIQRAELKASDGISSDVENLDFTTIASFRDNPSLIGLNSTQGKSYRYVDNDPALTSGVTYLYRLIDVATDGFSAWHAPIPVQIGTSSVPGERSTNQLQVGAVMPNPASDRIILPLRVINPQTLTVEIFSVDGTVVATPIESRSFAAGVYDQVLPVTSLAPGLYTLRISTDDFTMIRTRQFVVVR